MIAASGWLPNSHSSQPMTGLCAGNHGASFHRDQGQTQQLLPMPAAQADVLSNITSVAGGIKVVCLGVAYAQSH